MAEGTGSWLSNLVINDEVMWNIEDEVPRWNQTLTDGNKTLPSDMMHRTDIPFMLQKDWESAENQKLAMEEQQRHDAKIREVAHQRKLKENPYYKDKNSKNKK